MVHNILHENVHHFLWTAKEGVAYFVTQRDLETLEAPINISNLYNFLEDNTVEDFLPLVASILENENGRKALRYSVESYNETLQDYGFELKLYDDNVYIYSYQGRIIIGLIDPKKITTDINFVEYIAEFLGTENIVEINEINNHKDSLWVKDGELYFISNFQWNMLQQGQVVLKSHGMLTDSIDTANENHVEFLKWYYLTDDSQQAIQRMYTECGWTVTDIDCCQAYKVVEQDKIYVFRENRQTSPNTMTMVEDTINYDQLTEDTIIEECSAFGYEEDVIKGWIESKDNIPLMVECYFEMS